ncbi:MAG: winged helix DNA-binding protein [bacterium]|nr:winged helix DNA-binding protein [bacterium]
MTLKEDQIMRFSSAMERMIVMMMEVDNTCVMLTQDISKQDLSLVGYIGREGSVIMRDVAAFLDIPYSTATGIVDKLVAKDYLDRYNSPEDRRTVLVRLTKKGEGVFLLFQEKKREMSQLMLEDLSEVDRESVLVLLDKIMDNLSGKKVVLEEA